jgi:hypothetical protein
MVDWDCVSFAFDGVGVRDADFMHGMLAETVESVC